jgi:hypothetical protein
MESSQHKLKVQIEYYLSDENLQKDKFFHEKISNDPEGYLDIDHIMNCNKIKALNVTKDDVVSAVKHSNELELDNSNTKIKRKGNKHLPLLKLLNKKRKADESEEDDNDNEAKSLDPVILEIHSDKEVDFKWQIVQDEFKKLNPSLKVIYVRFNKDSGHVGVIKTEDLKFVEEFNIQGINFTVQKCEGDNLINFWKDHGNHFEFCLGKGKRNDHKNKKGRKDKNTLKKSVKLGNET